MQPGINDRLLVTLTEPLYSRSSTLCFWQLFNGILRLANIFNVEPPQSSLSSENKIKGPKSRVFEAEELWENRVTLEYVAEVPIQAILAFFDPLVCGD